tara:strand:- start:2425 stop:4143 length:1719 start_codon:yes stop_codon:yes gene_type:complete
MLWFDIETDGLKPTEIFCVGCIVDNQEAVIIKEPEDFRVLLSNLKDKHIVGHNSIAFDVPVLERLWKIDFSGFKHSDTLVLSRLACPNREGGHSLRNWGDILGFPKGEHSDWSMLTPEMEEYCIQDVRVTKAAHNELVKELRFFSDESISLEHQTQKIIAKQISNGWLFDQEKAFILLAELKEKKNDLEEKVQKSFKPLPTFVKQVTPKIKKDGTKSIVGLKFLGDSWETAEGWFSRIDWEPFNLGSRQQIGRHLQYFGWQPEMFTEKGHPIVDEKVLQEVKGIPEVSMIAEYLMLQKRVAQVSSWLDSVDSEDSRIRGYVNSNGAVTGRMTHSSPNTAQVPAVYSPYGEQCRACWSVPKGYSLVGVDASGLELRMLAHYMKSEEYTNEILNGDIHTTNQNLAGLRTRDQAKTFIYAFLYGAGNAKIGSLFGGNSRDGKRLKERFLENTPSLNELRERVTRKASGGYIQGLDGRRVSIRSEHSALNTLLQSAGAIVMKKSLCLLDEYAKLWKIEYKIVGNIHDEIQSEVKQEMAQKFGYLATECIKAAGEYYKLGCPLAGEYKVGANWAETH